MFENNSLVKLLAEWGHGDPCEGGPGMGTRRPRTGTDREGLCVLRVQERDPFLDKGLRDGWIPVWYALAATTRVSSLCPLGLAPS